jgi:hydroxymethylglutaryl-CoA reductase (NADPH)
MDPRNYPGQVRYILSGNVDTDKKHSRINMLLTRGKRVVAEATINREVLKDLMGVETNTVFWARQIQMAGSFLVGRPTTGRTPLTRSPRSSSRPVRT